MKTIKLKLNYTTPDDGQKYDQMRLGRKYEIISLPSKSRHMKNNKKPGKFSIKNNKVFHRL